MSCLYVWLPKDVEILEPYALVNRKPPKSCARCKSKSWQKPLRNTSVARIKALLRGGEREKAIVLLSLNSEKNMADIMVHLERDGYQREFLNGLLLSAILLCYPKKE